MSKTEKPTRILYNGRCNVCNGEITTYARYAAKHNLPLWFEDLNESDLDEWGLSRIEAMSLLHVRHRGEAYEGMAAYLVLWGQMPRYRPLARLFGLPVLRQVSTFLYDQVLSRIMFSCMSKFNSNASRPGHTLKP